MNYKKIYNNIIENRRLNVYDGYTEKYHKIYIEYGFDEFVKITNYKYTKQNLVQKFEKYVEEFLPQNGKKRSKKTIPT